MSLISFAGSDSTFGREGIKGREEGKRGRGGRLFKGADYFKYFRPKGGDYSREAINRGTAITRENAVLIAYDHGILSQ